jgi:hypothetical protein
VASSEPEKEGLDLNIHKVAGGALAAVTTAVAASFFGVNGTLTGAAFGSVISSVAAAVYATSLKRAGKKIKTTRSVAVRPSAAGAAAAALAGVSTDPNDPTAVPPEMVGRSVPLPGQTDLTTAPPSPWPPPQADLPSPYGPPLPTVPFGSPDATVPFGSPDATVPFGRPVPNQPHPAGQFGAPTTYDTRRRLTVRSLWKPMALMAAVTFVIAVAVISVTELGLGHPIGNSKDSGTSVGTVARGGAAATSTSRPATHTSTSTRSSTESSSSTDTSTSTTDTQQGGTSPTGGSSPSPSGTGSPAPSGPTGSPQPGAGGAGNGTATG